MPQRISTTPFQLPLLTAILHFYIHHINKTTQMTSLALPTKTKNTHTKGKGGVQGEWGISGINAEAAPARAAGPGSAWVQPRRRPAGHFALSSSGGGFGSRLDESFRWIYGLTPGEFHNNKLNVT